MCLHFTANIYECCLFSFFNPTAPRKEAQAAPVVHANANSDSEEGLADEEEDRVTGTLELKPRPTRPHTVEDVRSVRFALAESFSFSLSLSLAVVVVAVAAVAVVVVVVAVAASASAAGLREVGLLKNRKR